MTALRGNLRDSKEVSQVGRVSTGGPVQQEQHRELFAQIQRIHSVHLWNALQEIAVEIEAQSVSQVGARRIGQVSPLELPERLGTEHRARSSNLRLRIKPVQQL